MTDLPDDIKSLKAIIQQLVAENERLKAENAEPRRRLGLNSTNSHQPPSSDGYQKKTAKPGLPKAGNRANGGQAGHRGNTLQRVAQPDQVQIHLPRQCRCCGRAFSPDEVHEVMPSRQVFDVPEPKLEVTEHRLVQIQCCGVWQRGEYPAEVTAAVQYGAGVRALVTKLSVDHKMPLEQISQLFEDLYGYDLNSATIEEALERGYTLAEPIEQQVVARLLAQETVHFDETGVRVAGRLHWLHTASTATHTHLFVHAKRGNEALASVASVLKDFHGTAVHDCWSPYFQFQQARHVLCGAHLLRELNNLMENGSRWAKDLHQWLWTLHQGPRPVAAADDVRGHYRRILAQADGEEPPPQPSPRGKPKQSKGRNLLNRLREHEGGVLAFALEPGIPFTNNQAERDLRPAKVKQKVSGCFRTQPGAQVYARLQAAISTFRKQLNVFTCLRQLFLLQPVTVA
ncbi:MAG TPA: IS66 family transposase [Candidatus Competibacter sp.]|nr:IS66 family transposase [Candidatus Competibacteraceae bacterium]MCP5133665.1 IS66 family transposase [Gammaproteobacteria bacterium]HPE73101.1 IS66 family transposase [Candidatus Competibacter sp.]